MDNKPYKQKNKAVYVRFDEATMKALKELATERRWSMASAVAYCVEQQLNLPFNPTINRK